ncbi:TMM81 protein, partial [Pitta sordida]|nr:TMM81 protein [Pitta sordida]
PGISIPEELTKAVAKIAVNSTPCSVTCGLGLKVEEMCELSPGGEQRNCSLLRSYCLSTWSCGLRHLCVPAGRPVRLSCLASDPAGLNNHTYGYSWALAPGLVTTNDLLFQPLGSPNPRPALRLRPAREADAGTYRCDVQVTETFKPVKRIYFGLKVIPGERVGLECLSSPSREQEVTGHLEEGDAGNGGHGGQEPLLEQGWFFEAVLGIGSGVTAGLLVTLLLCCL